MNFTKELRQMKKGIPMKLPSWGGYWCWDNDTNTIIVYTKDHQRIDIRETENVESTLHNVLSDEWISADGENCSILGGVPAFGFGDAIKYIKRGFKVKRLGWNGKNQHIELAKNISYISPDGVVTNCNHRAIGNYAIAFVGTSGIQMGWLASQADMLADDWVFYKEEENAE